MYLEEYTVGLEWKTEPVTISREELLDFTMRLLGPHREKNLSLKIFQIFL